IPEGSYVEKGDRLVELDASELIDRKADQEIELEKAEALLVQAEQDLIIIDKEIQASEETAASRVQIAKMDLEKFLGKLPKASSSGVSADVGGTNKDMVAKLNFLVSQEESRELFPLVAKVTDDLLTTEDLERDMGQMAQDILEQIDGVLLAEADLKLKKEEFEQSEKLRAREFISQNQLESDKFKYDSSLSKVTLEKNKLDLLINYSLKTTHIQLSQDYKNSILELERVKASNIADRARKEADLQSARAERDLSKERFDNLVFQIDNTVITAPNPGLVVYATQGDGRRGREVVEEGGQVRERQDIIVLPDVSRMLCDLKVQEADVNKVLRGQTAEVKVDAFDGRTFNAKVLRVSPLPDSGDRWTNNDRKVYKTTVALDGRNTVLRPGVSAKVEIVISEVEDATYVPIQAVRRQGAVRFVWREGSSGPEAVRVEVGENNLTHVQILDPLKEGERVYLSPPPGLEAPTYEQPEFEDMTEEDAPGPRREGAGNRPEGRNMNGSSSPSNGSFAGASSQNNSAMTAIREALAAKFPERTDLKAEGFGWMRAMREPEVQQAIKDDPQLNKMVEEWRNSRSERGGRRGGGSRGGGSRGGRGGRGDRGPSEGGREKSGGEPSPQDSSGK
ncbi:MAG: efflux RND transporter periplasmic adaptor subunit, partial [Planctomycetota bacterium]